MPRKLNEQTHCSWCGQTVTYPSEWMSQCSGCGYRNYLPPRPCSNLIIVQDGKVAMIERGMEPQKGKLDLPGGFMDMTDDSMETCVLRELQEEIGVPTDNVQNFRYFGSGVNDYIWMDSTLICACFFFVCELSDYTTQLDPEETTSLRWVSKEDLPQIDFAWDIDKKMLTKYFSERN